MDNTEQWKTIAREQEIRIAGLVDMLTKRFIRSSPIEEQLLAIGVGKRDLPTREECKQWGIKLGVPAEFEVLKENPNATPC
jgi:hypothetical protein